MKANKVNITIAIVVVIITISGFAFLTSSSQSPQSAQTKQDTLDVSLNELTPEQLRAMGIQGDSPQDTLRTIVAHQKTNEEKFQQVLADNEKLRQENAQYKRNEREINNRINDSVRNETQPLLTQIDAFQAQLTEALANFAKTPAPATQGGQNKEAYPIGGASGNPSNTGDNTGGRRTIQPRGKGFGVTATADGTKTPTAFGMMSANTEGSAADKATSSISEAVSRTKNSVKPVYTIPENSTLLGARAMTALIGRVPVGNNVSDPYPFKAIIGRDNLIANGIELPDVEGAIVSGSATGDWTLSCVRGTVSSLTFIFADGRIVTSSQTGGSGFQGQSGSQATSQAGAQGASEGIGWLSDAHGSCVQGERKTNAPEYLGTNFLLAGASAAAQGLSSSQTTTVVDSGGVLSAVTGDQGKYVLGQALGGGLNESAEWVRERFGQNFDAIYVPPGHPVAIHITKQIAIDYDKSGRKVKYPTSQTTSQLD